MRRMFLVLAFWLSQTAGPALAQSAVTIDLNKLEPVENACRAYFVLENATARSFSSFVLDLYVFGPDGVINKRLAVDAAPLIPDKTRVRPVDIVDAPCESVSFILLNDVLDCADESGKRDDCVTLLSTTSHSDAEFHK